MQMCGVYRVGGNDLRLKWNETNKCYDEYYEKKKKGAKKKV